MRIEALLNIKKERKAIGNTITATEGLKQELSLGVESAGHRVYCKPKLPFTSSPTIKQITNLWMNSKNINTFITPSLG